MLKALKLACVVCLSLWASTAVAQMRAPLCGVPVFAVPGHPMGGQATYGPGGQAVILVDPYVEAQAGSGFMRFMLAHECAHHVRWHLVHLSQVSTMGPYAVLSVNPGIELDADCWAARQLARLGDIGAIENAAAVFGNGQGPFSAPGYPSGWERADNILRCGSRR